MQKNIVKTVNIQEAKAHLSKLLARVSGGEEIVITKAGKPLARILPFETPKKKRTAGEDRGLIQMGDDFDSPLPEEWVKGFEQ